ncbi:D-methionine transport system permease protein MetI [Achromobacter deleyi]|jgi:D-methionine transport system permease protein|uniref:D-methionine transport system permease protein MetI n=1 Tax=Achromobacter deleyi TaxID=1353891 RepID=A0A6S7ALS0_9BURK|nr:MULTISPECIES: methionine ABC transporter permease [Achromobacter]RBL82175.1 ABC transporter permease [Streptomyces cavourensis]CAB3734744.1 D-methionine transport system permease protein MetI [Achromobacter deleyi]CAB3816769.1 D-methionine transport system permease protein MetI [Achromobacter deleyi]CAB3858852.1 D-methionine transport system permease protein MetI [Achromobacter deleyi]CAB3870938.1 D-methionine transport system permease protein MetI [Achromobacter deleyi]
MSPQLIDLLITSLLDTLLMVGVASAIAVLVGIPLGVILTVTARGSMLENQPVNHALGAVINATRSVPFVILMVAIIPFTRLVAQTSIGTTAAIVPLSVAAIPFMARIAENAMREVDPGLITAARAMGASPMQIIMKVLLPEALPGLIAATIVTVVSLIGYSAMAGAIGGGGLGDLAIRYGYQRFQSDVMAAVVIVLIVLVQLIQSLGDRYVRRISHR